MTALATDVFDELTQNTVTAAVRLDVGALPACNGDPAMLRQVWINLLSNALKFSSDRDVPLITVGSATHEGALHYWVRDNGVGFDMRYVDKIFGVFQRLHAANEYPGTGVGLAIVERVVTRHGGRVWAESVLNEGATFHFALPLFIETAQTSLIPQIED